MLETNFSKYSKIQRNMHANKLQSIQSPWQIDFLCSGLQLDRLTVAIKEIYHFHFDMMYKLVC